MMSEEAGDALLDYFQTARRSTSPAHVQWRGDSVQEGFGSAGLFPRPRWMASARPSAEIPSLPESETEGGGLREDEDMATEALPPIFAGVCPCGEPKDGHRHWDGYWTFQARERFAEAMLRGHLPTD